MSLEGDQVEYRRLMQDVRNEIYELVIKPMVELVVKELVKKIQAHEAKNKPPFWAPDVRKGPRK